MDQQAQFALMTKATAVFSQEDTFLSFPLTPLVYPKGDLDLDELNVNNIVEFSIISNMIPRGILWDRTSDSYLWDLYGKILEEGTFALSTRTDEQEASYRLARGVLETKNAEGTFSESPQLQSYHTYQALYENAVQEYNTQSGTALTLTDPEELKEWSEITEPKLRLAVLLAKENWERLGYREMVETAKSVIDYLAAKSPLVTRGEWQRSFNEDIDTLTRPQDQMKVFPTSLAPATALAEGSWLPFKLTRAEIKQLVEETPKELKDRYGIQENTDAMESIEFEFSSAKLLRPWFNPEALKARYWTFSGDTMLSDGETPPKGEMPYYSVAVVFARNIVIRRKGPKSDNETFDGFKAIGNISNLLKSLKLQKIPLRKDRLDVVNKIRFMPIQELKLRPALDTKAINNRRDRMQIIFPNRILPNVTVDQYTRPGGSRPPVSGGQTVIKPIMGTVLPLKPHIPEVERPKPEDVITTVKDTDNIHILAFVCKALPKSPDPDPDLQW